MPFSTILTALFYPYIAYEQTAQNFDFCQFAHCASLFTSRSAIAPKMKVRSRAIEPFERAMCPALVT